MIRVQILEEAKIRNFWRAYHLLHGMDKRFSVKTQRNNCKILCHMCDCTIVENPNKIELEKAQNNAALDKKDRSPGSLKIEEKKRLTGKTSFEYKEICESIELRCFQKAPDGNGATVPSPYVYNRPEVNIINVTSSRDNLNELVDLVIKSNDALITATKGGGDKSFLMTATAVELKKTKQKCCVFTAYAQA